mgnify:CR=1 FL=1
MNPWRYVPTPVVDLGVWVLTKISHLAGTNRLTFNHEGEKYEIYYNQEHFKKLWLFIDDSKTSENIPFSLLDLGEDVDVIVDAGAHIGSYTILLSKLNPGHDVFAFEPHPDNAGHLLDLMEMNNLEVVIDEKAVVGSGAPQEIDLHSSPNSSESHSIRNNPQQKNKNGRGEISKVETISLSTRLEGYSSPFFKIDVEGAEYSVLRDIILCSSFEDIRGIVEIHPDKMDQSVEECLKLFEKADIDYKELGSTVDNYDQKRPGFYFEGKVGR